MSTIEAGLRGAGITVLLLLAALAWRDARQVPAARYGVLFMLCGVAYLVESAPPVVFIDPLWIVPLRLLSNAAPAVFLLWATATFDDAFRPSWVAWLPTAAMLALGGWALAAHHWLPWRIVQGVALVLVGVGLSQVLRGRDVDLDEGRRRFRPVLAASTALAIAAFVFVGALSNRDIRSYSSVITATVVLGLAVATALLRLGLRLQPELPVEPIGEGGVAVAALDPRANATVAIDPEERALLDRLRQLMDVERIHREEGLGIATLAARLGIPEYRLRRLINQRLGHRNFTSFVNGYRLAEAAAALADPTQAQVPILTIALDAGFQSIGPFNRAFKAQTGMTPSDFRRERSERSAAQAAE
ncbi:MAG TPA: AraC family transcriptional regulator [Stellaceae bacterium]|nr:AraC family transcriptional regulator [Stellaceae bacterium]